MAKHIESLLDGVSNESLDISITVRPNIPAPELETEFFEIEGRHGYLTKIKKFKDIQFDVEYNILEMLNVKPLLRKIRGFFYGKSMLQFSDDDIYYKIKSAQIGGTNNEIEEYGKFTVTFTCDPFQYEAQARETITAPVTIINPGTVESEPYLKVYGTGDITLTINTKNVYLYGVDGYAEIDSQDMEYHKDLLPIENGMGGDFPIFEVGENDITWTGTVTKIEMDGRWRYI